MCVCPRSWEENGGEGIAVCPSSLGGDFSLSVSLSLSVWWAHVPYSKNLSKKRKKKRDQQLHYGYVTGLPCSRPRFKSWTWWLKTHAGRVCVRAQDPERRMEEKGLLRDHPPWGVISRFLSLCLCLSGECTRPIAKKTLSKTKTKTKNKKTKFGPK